MYKELLYFLDYFFIYSFGGWIVESTYCSIFAKPKPHWINRGFLYGPYIPIYGCGSLIVVYLLQPFYSMPLNLFLLSMILCSTLEYVTSVLMEKMFHTRWWDYSDKPFNINGRICLTNCILFGCLSLVLMYGIHPYVTQFLLRIEIVYLSIITLIMIIVFGFDLGFTLYHLLRRNKILQFFMDNASIYKTEWESINEMRWINLIEKMNSDPRFEPLKRSVEKLQGYQEKLQSHLQRAYPTARLSYDMKQLKVKLNELKEKADEKISRN